MAQFVGPAAFAVLVVLWWAFLSRAALMEKAIGVSGLVTIGIVTACLADRTLYGYGIIISVVPWGVTAFAVALVCLGSVRSIGRTWLALFAALVGFGYWDLVRTDETRGDFETKRSWRWQPSRSPRSRTAPPFSWMAAPSA